MLLVDLLAFGHKVCRLFGTAHLLNHHYNNPVKMTENSKDQEAVVEAKQKYIRENVDPNLYEDFAQFCLTHNQTIDINAWSMDYIVELIDSFKRFMADQMAKVVVESSFAIYQTGKIGDLQEQENFNHDSILEELNEDSSRSPQTDTAAKKQDKPNTPVSAKHSPTMAKKSSPTPISPAKIQNNPAQAQTGSSAVDLLDMAFQTKQKQGEAAKVSKKLYETSRSLFDSVQFWEVPTLNEPSKTNNTSPSLKPENSQKVQQKHNMNKKSDPQQIQPVNYSSSAFQYFNTSNPSSMSMPSVNKSNFDDFHTFTVLEPTKKMDLASEIKPKKEMKKTTISRMKIKEISDYNPSVSESIEIKPQSQKRKRSKKPKNPNDPNRVKVGFQDHVACIKSAPRPLLNQEPQIKITGHQVISRSIFAPNYLMYTMEITPGTKICKRNYEDFSRLRLILAKWYPGVQLPYLAKEGWLSDTSDDFANREKQCLEMFLRDILSHPELRNSRIIEDFLNIADHKGMKRKFEEYSRMDALKSIEELCLLQGKVEIKLTEDGRVYKHEANLLFNKVENHFDKLRKLNETLTGQYQSVMLSIRAITDVIKEMIKDVESFNDSVSLREVDSLEESLQKMLDGFKQNYCRIKFEQEIIVKDVLPFVKYEKENTRTCKEMVETANHFSSKYQKRSHTESGQSSNSYVSKKYKEFKQGVGEESKNFTVLKYQTGFWQAQVQAETQRVLEWLGNKIEKRWGMIAKKYLDELAGSINLWSSVLLV